jgi:hypothetical protein
MSYICDFGTSPAEYLVWLASSRPHRKEQTMRNLVTTMMFATASLLGTVGIVTFSDPAVAQTPVVQIVAR